MKNLIRSMPVAAVSAALILTSCTWDSGSDMDPGATTAPSSPTITTGTTAEQDLRQAYREVLVHPELHLSSDTGQYWYALVEMIGDTRPELLLRARTAGTEDPVKVFTRGADDPDVRYTVLVLDGPVQFTAQSHEGLTTHTATIVMYHPDTGPVPPDGQRVTRGFDSWTCRWPTDASLPLGEPRCDA